MTDREIILHALQHLREMERKLKTLCYPSDSTEMAQEHVAGAIEYLEAEYDLTLK